MKKYLARVFSLHPLSLLVGLCVLFLAPLVGRWLWLAPGASERAARGAAQELAAGLRQPVLAWLTDHAAPVLKSAATVVDKAGVVVEKTPTLVNDARKDVVKTGAKEVADSRRDILAAIHNDVVPPVYAALGIVNRTRGDAVRAIADLSATAKPVLDNTAALVKDAKDSWDDSYWEVKAMVESATVFTTSGAQMADAARAALPKFLALGEEMGKHFTGITSDVHGMTTDAHTLTSKWTAPKTKKQKAWGVIETVLFLGARVAAGGR